MLGYANAKVPVSASACGNEKVLVSSSATVLVSACENATALEF